MARKEEWPHGIRVSTLLPSRRKTTSSSKSPLMNRTLPASFQSHSPSLLDANESGISNGLIHNFVYLCNNAEDFPSHHSVECQNSSFPNDVDQTRYRNGNKNNCQICDFLPPRLPLASSSNPKLDAARDWASPSSLSCRRHSCLLASERNLQNFGWC